MGEPALLVRVKVTAGLSPAAKVPSVFVAPVTPVMWKTRPGRVSRGSSREGRGGVTITEVPLVQLMVLVPFELAATLQLVPAAPASPSRMVAVLPSVQLMVCEPLPLLLTVQDVPASPVGPGLPGVPGVPGVPLLTVTEVPSVQATVLVPLPLSVTLQLEPFAPLLSVVLVPSGQVMVLVPSAAVATVQGAPAGPTHETARLASAPSSRARRDVVRCFAGRACIGFGSPDG